MSDKNETIDVNSNNISTKQVIAVLCFIVLVVVGFYFFNFNSHIFKSQAWWQAYKNVSPKTGVWGEFGDYVGGILNPVIAAFAFYLIAKTYELQKRELEATRSLLGVSTDAQKNQIKLAALTALLNSNLMRIEMLKSERLSLLQGILPEPKEPENSLNIYQKQLKQFYAKTIIMQLAGEGTPEAKIRTRFDQIELEINTLTTKNNELEEQIKAFLKA